MSVLLRMDSDELYHDVMITMMMMVMITTTVVMQLVVAMMTMTVMQMMMVMMTTMQNASKQMQSKAKRNIAMHSIAPPGKRCIAKLRIACHGTAKHGAAWHSVP